MPSSGKWKRRGPEQKYLQDHERIVADPYAFLALKIIELAIEDKNYLEKKGTDFYTFNDTQFSACELEDFFRGEWIEMLAAAFPPGRSIEELRQSLGVRA